MSTCNWLLDLETLGSRSIMPNFLFWILNKMVYLQKSYKHVVTLCWNPSKYGVRKGRRVYIQHNDDMDAYI